MTHRISLVDVGNIAAGNLLRLVVALAFAAPLGAQDDSSAVKPLVTIKEVMEKTITPATNALWNVPESPTDEEWAALEEAAVTLLVAANVIELGGTGPLDDDWAKQPAWRAFDKIMIDAANASLAAVRARNVTALQSAGDVLYPPCEGCHAQFNPGVVEAQ
jgi:cytochrome c556